jgi:cytochrome bd-type quinol oxidase subunit 2
MRLTAIFVVLALALAGAIWLFYSEREKNREQADQIAKLPSLINKS